MSISQVADRTGLSVHTLRFYERKGLLIASVRRSSGGRRICTEADVEWLDICTRLRASGMPLAKLQTFAAMVRRGPGNEAERLSLLREHQHHIENQLAELRGCLDLITWKVGVYEQHLSEGTAPGLWDPSTSEDPS